MGIYLFRLAVLQEVLGEDAQRQSTHDLGRAILPGIIGWYRVAAFPFVEGIGSAPTYWRDGGAIDAYWEAHIDLLDPQADFQLSQSQEPLRAASAQGTAVIFAEGFTALRVLATWLEAAMQEEVRAWVRSGATPYSWSTGT
jgi:glucose-1-phosphate adenylyltransferase